MSKLTKKDWEKFSKAELIALVRKLIRREASLLSRIAELESKLTVTERYAWKPEPQVAGVAPFRMPWENGPLLPNPFDAEGK